jgi:hypothetical protein
LHDFISIFWCSAKCSSQQATHRGWLILAPASPPGTVSVGSRSVLQVTAGRPMLSLQQEGPLPPHPSPHLTCPLQQSSGLLLAGGSPVFSRRQLLQ